MDDHNTKITQKSHRDHTGCMYTIQVPLTGAELQGAALGVHGEVPQVHGAVGVDGQPAGNESVGRVVEFSEVSSDVIFKILFNYE